MKNQFWNWLRRPPRLSKADILWLILPSLIWAGDVHFRDRIITLRCTQTPSPCVKENLWPLDRWVVGSESAHADQWSFITQDSAGVLVVVVPLIWGVSQIYLGQATLAAAAIGYATNLVVSVEVALWNGAFTESARLIAQRPRPFVYQSPAYFGQRPAHYTSFYSGHTSFTASAGVAMVSALFARGFPLPGMVISTIFAIALTFATGAFRVLSGRHFVTDVLVGALAGWIVALLIVYRKRRIPKS